MIISLTASGVALRRWPVRVPLVVLSTILLIILLFGCPELALYHCIGWPLSRHNRADLAHDSTLVIQTRTSRLLLHSRFRGCRVYHCGLMDCRHFRWTY